MRDAEHKAITDDAESIMGSATGIGSNPPVPGARRVSPAPAPRAFRVLVVVMAASVVAAAVADSVPARLIAWGVAALAFVWWAAALGREQARLHHRGESMNRRAGMAVGVTGATGFIAVAATGVLLAQALVA
ncbi:hypothetical protein [Neoactinobaculum massilliense]|uniref:hypothetical protein n=1 Tax=Neoactinobaculum massilliense TaxID=2364794 RepID=UPI000F52FBD0|nr:hypothetical protein [Neoactinobaculum massilliense]